MVHLLCEDLQALATAGAGHEGEGILGFIICLNPAALANRMVQNPFCSCRQGTAASLEVCIGCTLAWMETISVRRALCFPCILVVEAESCHCPSYTFIYTQRVTLPT